MGTVISDLLRNVFMFLDSIVYSFIGKVYELFIAIANTNIFAEGTINEFANRVYALLAIFMLFRLSFSILTYIINPDNINDKSAGGGKLIGNILITIILLISVPWLFQQVLKIQSDILNDNIIGKIILGVNINENDPNVDDKKTELIESQLSAGDNMAWTTFSAFFSPTDECENLPANCKKNFPSDDAYDRIVKSKLVSGIKDSGLATVRAENDEYVFDYLPIISTIAGGFIAYILLLFCFQIAVRSVKLGVLQLIAPIPVISYLDPKQGKDGMFKKWLKVCGKTFADLFIRLAAIYFAIFIITEITNGRGMTDITTGDTQSSLLVKVLIIFGALMFAKELPKFIEEITGIKLGGGFSLNPMKTLASIPLVGGAAAAGLGIAGAGALAAGRLGTGVIGSGAKALVNKATGGRHGESFKSGMATATSRAGMRMRAGLSAAGSNWSNFSGDGKYTASKEKYKSLTEDYAKGKKAFKEIDKNWKEGEKLRQKLDQENLSWSDFDGQNDAAYNAVYNHDEFRRSLKKLDLQDAMNKQYVNALYAAQTGTREVKVAGKTYNADGKVTINGHTYGVGDTYTVNGETFEVGGDFSALKEASEKSQKTLAGLEKVHDTMRQKYSDDAKKQDAIKARKYNDENPASR